MMRLFSWILALLVFLVVLKLHIGIFMLFDIPSMAIAWAFPFLVLLSLFSPGRIWRAVKHLRAPMDAGISASEFHEDAEIFSAFGILSLSGGTIGSLISLISILSNLTRPEVLGANAAVSMLTLLYALIGVFFVAFPASRLLSNAAREATFLEDAQEEESV